MSEGTHNVYVVRLSDGVLNDRSFREANPQYIEGKPCAYVGVTGLSPDERFANHKRGHKANKYVKEHGEYLMRRQFESYNPMSYEDACRKEVELAERLRSKGYAVWQN